MLFTSRKQLMFKYISFTYLNLIYLKAVIIKENYLALYIYNNK